MNTANGLGYLLGAVLALRVLRLAGVAAPLVWGRLLSRRWGGRPMGILMATMGTGAALPVLSTAPPAVFLSAALFGAAALTVVASALVLLLGAALAFRQPAVAADD